MTFIHRPSSNTKEQGFTLIELLVVVLIIGILTAIAVPAFLNQRKSATEASLKSDLKSAAITMESEIVRNNGKYLSYLPNYENRSDGIKVTLRKDKSSNSQFCLEGTSEANTGLVMRYSSLDGGLLPAGEDCRTPMDGSDFTMEASTKKVIVIETTNNTVVGVEALKSYGFKEVTIKNDATLKDLGGYDLVVAFGDAWMLKTSTENLLKQAYDAGYKVLTDGNDTGSWYRSWMFAESTNKATSLPGLSVYYNKTGATGLSPSFPYTFTDIAFNSDAGWQCVTKLQPGVVPIATSPAPDASGTQCITAAAANNGNGGRFFHMTKYYGSGKGVNVLNSGIDWLLM